MLVTMADILDHAKAGNYGVAAPNVSSENEVRAVIEVAEELNAPMIIDLDYFVHQNDFVYFGQMICDLIRKSKVPMCLNLDHGESFEQVLWAIRAGFTSVMGDFSMLPYDENVAAVKEVVKVAHPLGISVESELGHVGWGSNYEVDGSTNLTDPKEAAKYVEDTGIDMLAVAIGSAHGMYKSAPHIDFNRLAEIRSAVEIPLVLHGGSSTGDENLSKACRSGISKVNLCSDLFIAGREALRLAIEENPDLDVYTIMPTFIKGYKDKLTHYAKLFGQAGKAWTPTGNTKIDSDLAEDKVLPFDFLGGALASL